ncbi:Hcp family type VI secretion system effector [Erwinia billingiae]|uniref:Hcp family type VI secretion system effector n=1 Tax=Erwinia billingiae TaxID=182337 RepID=UPI002245C481|nr:type VI secretion system tube protein Hcp [Erwinia billingiae]MCX0501617.1 Hcp1 family type VI secretion system effector [Erwinia billingiae]
MNNLFMKLDNVSGESRDAGHSGWTDIQSCHWGVSRSEAGKKGANHQNLIVHAAVDKSTPTIFLYGSNGNKIRKVEISACKAGGTQVEYYRITLENVFVAGVMLTDCGETSVVQYEFQADAVKIQYWEQGTAGGKGAETRSGWDIKNNTSSF